MRDYKNAFLARPMARAETITKLALDEWATFFGINPLWFNGARSDNFGGTVCGQPWFQFAWQNADQISREDLARAIRAAEDLIEQVVGYNILPDWITGERTRNYRPADRTLFNSNGLNVRGLRKSITTKKAHVISGGIKAVDLITAATAVTRTDTNGDGYADLMTAAVTTTVTDPSQIRAFFPGEDGAAKWEIRPIEVDISGGVATITFKSWLLFDPDLYSILDAEAIDGDDTGNYLTSIDVYRVWNDPQQMVQFLWEPTTFCDCGSSGCAQCAFGSQMGCLMVRDPRLGFLAYAPGTWNSSTESFDAAEYTVCRDPDQLIIDYYSGHRDMNLARPSAELADYWKPVVAYYAAALLDREVCGCDNVKEFVKKWQIDLSRTGREVAHQTMFSQLGNTFGATKGGLFAFNRTIRTPDIVVAR
jgi:hypothetical protein